MKRHSLISGGLRREYLLFLPDRARALVIFLHGMGGTAAWADGETGWSQLAQREHFALALPEGLPPNPEQTPRFLINPPRWNDGNPTWSNREDFLNSASNSPEIDDVAFLEALIADVAAKRGSPFDRVFLTGFSNGAGMTFRFAADRAELLTAIAPVAGHCWSPEPRPARPIPTFYLVGAVDPLIPLRGGLVRSPWTHRLLPRPPVSETLERWARAIGCSEAPLATETEAVLRMDIYPGPVPFRSVVIEGLGHHWPGGQGQLNPRIAGPPSHTYPATDRIWEFFRELDTPGAQRFV